MKTAQRTLLYLLGVTLLPSLLWAAMPWQSIPNATHEALLGCRWRRCARVVPMPRWDNGVSFRLDFAKGPAFFVESVAETKQLVKVVGQEIPQTQWQTYHFRCTPEGRDADGNWLIDLTILGVQMKIDTGGSTIEFDSRDKGAAAPFMLNKVLVGVELRYHVTPQGNVARISGVEETLRGLIAKSPQMKPLLRVALSQGSLAQHISPLVGFLPTHPVQTGESWNRRSALELGPIGSFQQESQFTYVGTVNGLEKIEAAIALSYATPKEKSALGFTIKHVDLKTTSGASEVWFNAAKGRVVEATTRISLAGTKVIDVGGTETRLDLKQTQVQRIRVTDTNPLAQEKK